MEAMNVKMFPTRETKSDSLEGVRRMRMFAWQAQPTSYAIMQEDAGVGEIPEFQGYKWGCFVWMAGRHVETRSLSKRA